VNHCVNTCERDSMLQINCVGQYLVADDLTSIAVIQQIKLTKQPFHIAVYHLQFYYESHRHFEPSFIILHCCSASHHNQLSMYNMGSASKEHLLPIRLPSIEGTPRSRLMTAADNLRVGRASNCFVHASSNRCYLAS
jgi:hypothetical protein